MDDSVARVDWRVVDAVDEAWASERLPDDGARVRSRSWRTNRAMDSMWFWFDSTRDARSVARWRRRTRGRGLTMMRRVVATRRRGAIERGDGGARGWRGWRKRCDEPPTTRTREWMNAKDGRVAVRTGARGDWRDVRCDRWRLRGGGRRRVEGFGPGRRAL